MELSEKSVPGKVYDLLVQGDLPHLKALQRNGNFSICYTSGNIARIRCTAESLATLLEQNAVNYAEWPLHHTQTLNDTMVVRNRIKAVKQGAAPLSQGYDGSGILIGLIDTGIDFSHKDFKDAQGNSRIKFLWDQASTSGPAAPTPFNYGVEWTDADINANICTHSDLPHYGHGTHVSGIAAGNGLATGKFQGCAPNADIIMVALNFSQSGPTTADAVQYILTKASLLGKPCVINSSLGDYYGSHDATDLEAKMIENMISNVPGHVMVAAAGNGGNVKFHTKTQNSGTDTSFTWLYNGSNTEDYWFYGDTNQVKNLQISVGANRNSFSDLSRIAFKNYNYGLGPVQHDTLKHNGNRIGIIHNSSSINSDGVYELYLHIDADTANLFWRIETKGNGVHHAWNFDFVSSGLPAQSQYPAMAHYIAPDTMYSMVSGYQNSDEIITVANYVNLSRYYDVTHSLVVFPDPAGSLAATSSSGPTRDGRQKPDIAASGNLVFSCLPMAMKASQIAGNPHSVAEDSLHVRGGGTSAAAPVVAGLAALYLQAYPNATNQQVKRAITHCPYSDQFTGNSLPNYAWGYGKLDGFAAMLCEQDLVSIQKFSSESAALCFPNPFHNKVTIQLPKKDRSTIYIYSAEGKLLFEDRFEEQNYELDAPFLKGQQNTLFFVKITGNENNYVFKLIRE